MAAPKRSAAGPVMIGLALVALLLAAAIAVLQPVREAVLAPFLAEAPTAVPTAIAAKPETTVAVTAQPAVTPAIPTTQPATATPVVLTPTPVPATPSLAPTLVPTPSPNDRLAQARAAASAGNFTAALDTLDTLASTSPDLPGLDDARYDVRMAFARSLLDQANPDGAYGQYAEALKLRPNDAAALDGQKQIVLAKDYAVMEANWGKDDERAIQALEESRALDPGYRDTAQKLYALLIGKADRLLDAGERDAAFAVLMHALDVNPDGVEAKQRLTTYTPTPVPTPVPAPAIQQPAYQQPATRPQTSSPSYSAPSGGSTTSSPPRSSGGGFPGSNCPGGVCP